MRKNLDDYSFTVRYSGWATYPQGDKEGLYAWKSGQKIILLPKGKVPRFDEDGK